MFAKVQFDRVLRKGEGFTALLYASPFTMRGNPGPVPSSYQRRKFKPQPEASTASSPPLPDETPPRIGTSFGCRSTNLPNHPEDQVCSLAWSQVLVSTRAKRAARLAS